jgi:hypothetical protein
MGVVYRCSAGTDPPSDDPSNNRRLRDETRSPETKKGRLGLPRAAFRAKNALKSA